jgi:lipopolysaccharide export system permease protein
MHLFGRYIFWQTLSAVAMVVVSLTLVVWVALALKQLSILTSDGQSAGVFLLMTLLVLPDIITMIAPLALLIGCLHILNRLNGDSELIVMTAAGTEIWRFARTLMRLAVLVSLLMGIASFLVVPWSLRKLTELANQIRADIITQVLQPGQFSSPEGGITFHIRDRASNGDLLGLMLSDTRDEAQHLVYLADRSTIVKDGEHDYLVMQNGHILRTDPKKRREGARIISYDSYVIDLAVLAPKGTAEPPKPHARYLHELLAPDPEDYFYKTNPLSYTAELHDRLATMIYPFTFVMTAVAFLGQARTNRQGRNQAMILAFTSAIGLRLAGMAATNLAMRDAAMTVAVYGLPLGGLVLATFIAWRGMHPTPPNRFLKGVANRLTSPFALIKNLRWIGRRRNAAGTTS